MNSRANPKKVSPGFWVSSTYFAEGFPYSLVNGIVEILFQQMGASLKTIGLTSLFHLPWNIKFLWGPFVDQYETKRRWLLGVEIALSIMLLAMALVVGSADTISQLLVVCVGVVALLSATHDIAIDGFYLESLDEREQAAYVGFRATFYRIATIALGGPLLWISGRFGWFVGLLVICAVMVGLTAYHAAVLPHPERPKRPIRELVQHLGRPRVLIVAGLVAVAIAIERQVHVLRPFISWTFERAPQVPVVGKFQLADWVVTGLFLVLFLGAGIALLGGRRALGTTGTSLYARAFTTFLAQERALLLLVFVVLFRTGESFLMKMRWPFLNQDVKMGLDEYAIYNGSIGVAASIGATLAGGWLIARFGLRRCIWPFVLSQNVLNLMYMAVALAAEPSALPPWLLAGVIAVEHVGAGLGTAVFMVFLMRCCDPDHRAAHMAIVTALMSVSFTVAGVFSGYLAEALGFALYFGLTFVATIPSMLLIPFLPYLDGRRSAQVPSEEASC